jgi:hypothetical protein
MNRILSSPRRILNLDPSLWRNGIPVCSDQSAQYTLIRVVDMERGAIGKTCFQEAICYAQMTYRQAEPFALDIGWRSVAGHARPSNIIPLPSGRPPRAVATACCHSEIVLT